MVVLPQTKTNSIVLSACLVACIAALTPFLAATAEKPALPSWEASGGGEAPDGSLFPARGDIFDGAVNGSELAVDASFYHNDSGNSAGPSGTNARGVGAPVGTTKSAMGSPLGGSGPVGSAGVPGGVGFQPVSVVGAAGSVLGQVQRGVSGARNVMGTVNNVARLGQSLGGIGQGQVAPLRGILQRVGGAAGVGGLGNGFGAGPFSQLLGQNNKLLQGLQLLAILQQLFAAFLPQDSALQFNTSNTGASARTAFTNLYSNVADIGGGALSSVQTALSGGGANSFSNAIASRIGEITSGVPGTEAGNKACAWVVNDVFKQVHGATITGSNGSPLSVYDTMQAMERQPQMFTSVTREQAQASGGDYIIASNYAYGGRGSHIGFGRGETVWSNSSGRTSIQQNYTTSSWQNNYGATKYYLINQPS